MLFILTGIFGAFLLPEMVSTPMTKDHKQINKVVGIIMASIGLTICILTLSYFTPESEMVKNEFTIAEVESGVIEDISFKQNEGMVLTVNGEPLNVETNYDEELSLIGVDHYPYAHITPEIGATVDYKAYSYNDTDYVSVITYSQSGKD